MRLSADIPKSANEREPQSILSDLSLFLQLNIRPASPGRCCPEKPVQWFSVGLLSHIIMIGLNLVASSFPGFWLRQFTVAQYKTRTKPSDLSSSFRTSFRPGTMPQLLIARLQAHLERYCLTAH